MTQSVAAPAQLFSELIGFARRLFYDYAAVVAAMRYDWSQGPV